MSVRVGRQGECAVLSEEGRRSLVAFRLAGGGMVVVHTVGEGVVYISSGRWYIWGVYIAGERVGCVPRVRLALTVFSCDSNEVSP